MKTRSLLSVCAFLIASAFVVTALAQRSSTSAPVAFPQSETVCQNIEIYPPNRSFTSEGGNAFVNVEHEATNCTFTALSNSKWIRITSVTNSQYGGTIYYTVVPHPGSTTRNGTISVTGQTFAVQQINEPFQTTPDIFWTRSGHTDAVNAVAFSPDGRLVASASSDRSVKIWRANDGALLQTLTGFFDRVTSVAFSHDGQKLAAGSIDRNVRIWNTADWSYVGGRGTTDFIFGVAFSPDGTELAVAGGYSGNWIHIMRTSDWEETALLGYGQQENRSIAYSNNGQFLAWAMLYPGVRLQNAAGSYCILEGFDYYGFNGVAFSPDSQRVAAGSDSQELGVWDVASCSQLFSLNGPSGAVESVAYAPDGKIILAGGRDYPAGRGTLLFWRAADGALLRAVVGQTSTAVYSVQFSPRGNHYAYGCEDGRVAIAHNPFMLGAPLE